MIARTRREADRYAAISERRKALFERFAQPRIKKAIRSIGELAGEMYEQGGQDRIENLLADDGAEIIRPVLMDLYQRVIRSLGSDAKSTKKSLGVDVEIKTTDEEIDVVTNNVLVLFEDYAFEQSVIMARTVTDEVIKEIAKTLSEDAEIIQQGPRALARKIRSRVDTLSVYQSERIARTETLFAYSESQEEFTKELWDEAEDGPLYKQWYATRDKRTRDDHREMHKKTVRQDEKFRLPNGDELKYPGDRSGRAESVIQCRCSYSSLPEELV